MLVMYAVIASVNITKILIAGIVPGILMALAMSVAVYFISLKRGYGTAGTFSLKNIGKAAKQAVIPMLMPIIIMGGHRSRCGGSGICVYYRDICV